MTRFKCAVGSAVFLAVVAGLPVRQEIGGSLSQRGKRGALPIDSDEREEECDEKMPWYCQRSASRFSLLPLRDVDMWRMYKQAEASFWTAEEVDLQADVSHWQHQMNDDERHFLKQILAFFASSDGVVMENLMERLLCEVTLPEARYFYAFQTAIEAVHQETYSLLLETYVENPVERAELFSAHANSATVKEKADWAQKWTASKEASFAKRLVAYACVEGIFFSGSFCAVFWLRKRGLLPGLGFANELISRDEGLHCDFACLLYAKLQPELRLSDEEAQAIVLEAVQVERHFITAALPVSLVGMNDKLMGRYIEFVADRLLLSLGHPKIFHTTNPFDWMELISLTGKTNFFEKRVAEYQRPNVAAAADTHHSRTNRPRASSSSSSSSRKKEEATPSSTSSNFPYPSGPGHLNTDTLISSSSDLAQSQHAPGSTMGGFDDEVDF